MAKTVVGLFEQFYQAQNVVRELEEQDYQPEDMNVVPSDAAPQWALSLADGDRTEGTVVMVRATDEGAGDVADLMQSHGAANVEERDGDWRSADVNAATGRERMPAVAHGQRHTEVPAGQAGEARTMDIADIDANMPEESPLLGIRTDEGRPVSTRPYSSPGDVEP